MKYVKFNDDIIKIKPAEKSKDLPDMFFLKEDEIIKILKDSNDNHTQLSHKMDAVMKTNLQAFFYFAVHGFISVVKNEN